MMAGSSARPRSVRVRWAMLGCAFSVACGANGTDSPKTPLGSIPVASASQAPPLNDQLPQGITALAAAHLDSGNVAFRARQYDPALQYYRKAAEDVPEHPAPWYGLYMVAIATKDAKMADSATKAIAARTGGSDLLNNGMADNHKGSTTPSGLPADHPLVKPGQTSSVPVSR